MAGMACSCQNCRCQYRDVYQTAFATGQKSSEYSFLAKKPTVDRDEKSDLYDDSEFVLVK